MSSSLGIYLRTTQRRNRDGSVVRYVQLAHNRRKGDSTQAEVLINFGREDALDVDGLRRLVGSIGRYLDGTRSLATAPDGHWIAGERMRDGSPDAAAALARQGRYRTVRDNLRVKEVRIGTGDAGRRFVICHNPEQAARDAAARDHQLAQVTAELDRISRLRAQAANRGRGDQPEHTRAECALRDHPTLGRWLRQARGGRLAIDRAAVECEQRLDGKFLLSTSGFTHAVCVPPGTGMRKSALTSAYASQH